MTEEDARWRIEQSKAQALASIETAVNVMKAVALGTPVAGPMVELALDAGNLKAAMIGAECPPSKRGSVVLERVVKHEVS